MRKLGFCMLVLALAAFVATPSANANTITPGGPPMAPDSLAGGGTVIATITGTVHGINTHGVVFTVTYTEDVVLDSTNRLCPTCLEFELFFSNSSKSKDGIDAVSVGDFSQLLSLSIQQIDFGTTGSGTKPANGDWAGSGDVIDISYANHPVKPGTSAAAIELETYAKTYTSGGDVSFENNATVTARGFAPAAEPSSAVLLLLVIVAVAAAMRLHERRATV